MFDPLSMDVVTEFDQDPENGNPEKVLYINDGRLDAKYTQNRANATQPWGQGPNDLVSGNWSFWPLSELFFPFPPETENELFQKHMWGENVEAGFECTEHEYPDGTVGHHPCVNKTDPEIFLSKCTAMPLYWFTCEATNGTGWRGTGREPCWKGQEWIDIMNAAAPVYHLSIHPEHFDECLRHMINMDDFWKVIGPKFACACDPSEEKDGTLPPDTCKANPDKITESNPDGYFTDCSLRDLGDRDLLPVKYVEVVMIANGLDDTQKYVELIKWTRDVTTQFNDKYDGRFNVFPTGIPIIFWEQYVSLWDTIISSALTSCICVWVVMFTAFLFIQPESCQGARKYATAMWTSFLLVVNLMLITFSLLCLMGMSDIWLNGIPAMTLIASVGVAVEFTSHLTFA